MDKTLTVEAFEERCGKRARLSCLEVQSRVFRERRERERKGIAVGGKGQGSAVVVAVTESEVLEEKKRRREMAALKRELYGGGVGKEGRLAMDPEWDDVVPVVLEEPEGALAAIAYPEEYAEGELVLGRGVAWPGLGKEG